MKKNLLRQRENRGFALIATILLMVLLAIITVGTLSLSVVTLRSSTQDSAQARARANARMALMIAIGELQKQMGPDQRISANSAILDESSVTHSHWLGVWDSWITGDPANAPVGTNYPSGSSHHQTLGNPADATMHPDYANKDQHFRKWLVSLNDEEMSTITSPTSLSLSASPMPGPDDDAIFLVADGSLGDGADKIPDYVAARILDVKDKNTSEVTGRYGWWIGDESQKARIMADSYLFPPALTSADKIYRSQAPGSMGNTSITGLENITDPSQFAKIPSLATLDLVPNVVDRPAQQNFFDATPFSFSVLADVREGGLKRDLSTLLERTIDPSERSDEFMLYKFNTKDAWANNKSIYPNLPDTPQEAVPIQDLAAYYQLYDQSRKGGIEYTDSTIKTTTPDYGTKTSYTLVTDYSGMYRQPIPIKVQFVLTLYAEKITTADRDLDHTYLGADPDGAGPLPRPSITTKANLSIPTGDTDKLRLAVIPVVTMWNPYNVPLTMQSGAKCQSFRLKTPSFYINCKKKRSSSQEYTSGALNLTFASKSSSMTQGIAEARTDLMRLNFGYTGSAVTFTPGEVKIFSMPYDSAGELYTVTGNTNHQNNDPINNLEATKGWNATGFLTMMHSVPNAGNRNRTTPNTDLRAAECNVVIEDPDITKNYDQRYSMSLATGDELTFEIFAEPASTGSNSSNGPGKKTSPVGSALSFYMTQRDIAIGSYAYLNMRNYNLVTTMGTRNASTYPGVFVNQLISQGIPNGAQSYPIEPISANQVINASGGSTVPFMQFALMAGSEVSESIGDFAGRKFPMRPFLHSSVMSPTFIDDSTATGPYNHGWNWWFEDIGSLLGALVNNTQNGNGYYGGGYTPEAGVTSVVQQEIPVTPPISIAALSHARLGGFTLANEVPAGHGNTGTGNAEAYPGIGWIDDPSSTLGFQRVTATGQGGLYPHTLQVIGNSYAHPSLDSDVAYNDEWERTYHAVDGPRKVVFADHSYLANKALWDEFFFSSITPQLSTIQIFSPSNLTAAQVAQEFLLPAPTVPPKSLPNRRMTPYAANLDQTKLDALFTESSYFSDGLADKIASYMMIKGGFNINSTSAEAWKVFLSSLKGKPVAYLDGGATPKSASPTGTPIGGLTLPIGAPVTEIIDSKSPTEQWLGWRELSDDEIDQLAQAMVKQVKKRGPFLSLSEFVNRRLETTTATRSSPDNLAVMGALQAALDDPSVSINESFRDDEDRVLDAETNNLNFAFAEAAKGPTAYGSSAYIDQADVLRHLGSQMTTRGDTFVIRTYGDALGANGQVIARAWCEAIIQRVPDYVDSKDDEYLKFSNLQSQANKLFGRKFLITGFRWLNNNEI